MPVSTLVVVVSALDFGLWTQATVEGRALSLVARVGTKHVVTAKHVLPLVGRNGCPVCLLAGEVDLEQDA